jgi:hypothetical protein
MSSVSLSGGRAHERGEHRYEATVHLVVYADALDEAHRRALAAAEAAQHEDGVEEARVSIMDTHYRPRAQWGEHPWERHGDYDG